jgi:hypothetical protein
MGEPTLVLLMIVHDHSVLNVSILLSVPVAIERPPVRGNIGSAAPQGRRRPSVQ